jgi:hypothetical protein
LENRCISEKVFIFEDVRGCLSTTIKGKLLVRCLDNLMMFETERKNTCMLLEMVRGLDPSLIKHFRVDPDDSSFIYIENPEQSR